MTFHQVLHIEGEPIIQHNLEVGEWAAIEVLGYMIDKMPH